MHHLATLALLALLPFAPAYALAQEAGLEEAIETIATSSDPNAVNAAGAKLRAVGCPQFVHSLSISAIRDNLRPTTWRGQFLENPTWVTNRSG